MKFGTETVCKLTINSVAIMQNFEVITDKFNIYKICTSVVSSQSYERRNVGIEVGGVGHGEKTATDMQNHIFIHHENRLCALLGTTGV